MNHNSLTRQEVSDAFNKGNVNQDTDDVLLDQLLFTICTKRSDDQQNHPRDIARALYINHIKHTRFIGTLDRDNRKNHTWLIWLTVGLLIFTILLLILTVNLVKIAQNTDEKLGRMGQIIQTQSNQIKLKTNP